MPHRILIADDERNIRQTLGMILSGEGYQTAEAANGAEALAAVRADAPDALLLDLQLGDMDGLAVLKTLREESHAVPAVVISGHGSIGDAVEAMRLGAFDFIEKPLTKERVLVTLRNLLDKGRLVEENTRLRRELARRHEMVGEAPVMRDIFEAINKVGPTKGRVLITGESGTGKELIARAIHDASPRKNKAFIKVNCAAIPSELIESELFGHVKGAFTGALKDKPGKFQLADGGTLFLDEIGDMDLSAQAKVLRALQTGEVVPVGGDKSSEVDVRVLAATNKDLAAAIKDGAFREDLYYRLNVIPVHSPPLRERRTDIPRLVAHFLKELCAENGIKSKVIRPEAMQMLAAYDWPGNVRELRNIIERLVIMSGPEIGPNDLPPPLRSGQLPADTEEPHAAAPPAPALPAEDAETLGPLPSGMTLKELREEVERRYIVQALRENQGHVSRTAEQLGVERTHLHKKIRQYGLKSTAEEMV